HSGADRRRPSRPGGGHRRSRRGDRPGTGGTQAAVAGGGAQGAPRQVPRYGARNAPAPGQAGVIRPAAAAAVYSWFTIDLVVAGNSRVCLARATSLWITIVE